MSGPRLITIAMLFLAFQFYCHYVIWYELSWIARTYRYFTLTKPSVRRSPPYEMGIYGRPQLAVPAVSFLYHLYHTHMSCDRLSQKSKFFYLFCIVISISSSFSTNRLRYLHSSRLYARSRTVLPGLYVGWIHQRVQCSRINVLCSMFYRLSSLFYLPSDVSCLPHPIIYICIFSFVLWIILLLLLIWVSISDTFISHCPHYYTIDVFWLKVIYVGY